MGFWGTYILARADAPLTELPSLRRSAARVSWHWHGRDGWQAIQVDRGPDGWDSPDVARAWDGLLRGLTEQAGNPVLAAVIQHSEGAQLLGHSPVTGRWGGWLLADHVAWRCLPPDKPAQYWDEHGNRHTEDDTVYKLRQRKALDRLYATAGPPGSQAAPSVVAWAREAGLDPDPAAVAAILDITGTYAEDALFKFLAALGLPDPPTEDD